LCFEGLPSQKTCSARINPIPALLIKRKPNVTYTGWRGTGSESNSLKPIKLVRARVIALNTTVGDVYYVVFVFHVGFYAV